jgi:hypothetical protein
MDGAMLKNDWKKLLKFWCSVKNIFILLAVVVIAVVISKFFGLNSGEIASWVQAIGAIVSIWAAWSIAHSEGVRAAKEAKRQEISRCAGVIGILLNTKNAIESLGEEKAASLPTAQLKSSMLELTDRLDRIDYMNLPSQVFVDALCEIRKELNKINIVFQDPMRSFVMGLRFKISYGNRLIARIDECLLKCISEKERISLE